MTFDGPIKIIVATQEHLCNADLDENYEEEDETIRTGVVDSSLDRYWAIE